ncbi:hypothetical protein [Paenibacillus sp. MMS18-CY102]|uniref:hypothetical protein n=1 Tax=Paenibacillus sp. MMS18-CY102 TaxID=2682849 RepID=UPI0013659B59|nr:hypothetical protein [Paenibacillus sp. MMS18-CY102]MWC26917.1 hypothetical protein [Paenibacillus sp. MMS18-CY102]
MKILHYIWLTVFTIVLSSFGSSLLVAMGFGGGFLIAFIYMLFMTAVVGMPCSLVIMWLAKREDAWGSVLRGLLHVLAGGGIVAVSAVYLGDGLEELADGATVLFACLGALQGGIYYGVYLGLKKAMKAAIANEEESMQLQNFIE